MPRDVPVADVVATLRTADLVVQLRGALPATVSAMTDDSRAVSPGALFVAVRGAERDGHAFLPQVAERGAAMVVVEDADAAGAVPAVVVRDSRRAAAVLAALLYDHPARALAMAAVTGTNGKTTTVGILRHLLQNGGMDPAASIGTLGVLTGSAGAPLPGGSGLTTPGPFELQRVLRMVADASTRAVAMEVSSHSLDQGRVDGIVFRTAVFTNLTHDHLDYHGTLDAYFAAKARLIALLAPDATAVVNADDPAWQRLPRAPRRITFSMEGEADVRAADVRGSASGSTFTLAIGDERFPVHLPLLGAFNVSNALGAAGAAWSMGIAPTAIASALERAPQVPGRLEVIHQSPAVLRDYAHTPDALERALATLRPFTRGRLVVVVGCGGDRDRAKRPRMGAIAARGADLVILTSDNPRTEDPERILDEIEAGLRAELKERGTHARCHERIEDRRAAIARALEIAAPEDVVLLAGKGHETYQIRGTTRLPFDEREIVRELTGARAS
ncbi:MAG TPA: UDP-N-acetylmuramoyl-L-alanyl-D-glutamate--2,6-diaminopimelate ligase [Gemmatimonadaceae bacterium]|nr:UDP-N-acetylmuramoyl-L-alanyl-D-glutamate--2,6-diaminopimelate ligase [Gemmatimonadaceae bacterium]